MKTDRIHLLLVAAVLGCPADEGDATEETSTDAASTDAASTGEEPSTGEPSESSGDTTPLEIVGTYDDDFGGHHEITMTTWVYDTGDFGVITTNLMQHDNEARWVAGEDAAMAGTFVRFDWTYDGEGTLWYCNTVYDATSLEGAIEPPLADPADPAAGGCGGMFPWTMLTPA